ncbi:response regulator transcription factor [Acinetobacter wanghuae]|uniref:response regulator transcription factor n=1 Tax=Acinetobacter wanghuae TaxID=2662362 RepID=UPI003AF4BD63
MQPTSWNDFVDNFISALGRVVPLQSFFAYHLEAANPAPVFHSYYSKNIPRHSLQRYVTQMCQFDPINAINNQKQHRSFVHLKNEDIPEPYHKFLKDNQVLDNIELVFKSDNIPCLGISLIRSEHETAFTAQEIQIIKSCYDLAQYNSHDYLKTKPEPKLEHDITKLLTRSERQVLSHILTGKKNQEIADDLFVSLATVKTHIYHIFQKTMVKSKRELILKALKHA